MGNWNTLEGKNVLELRSGGGGGLGYIEKYLNPSRCIGVDEVAEHVQLGKEAYGLNPTMKFYLAVRINSLTPL